MSLENEFEYELTSKTLIYREKLENEIKENVRKILKGIKYYYKELIDNVRVDVYVAKYDKFNAIIKIDITIPLDFSDKIYFEDIEEQCNDYVNDLVEEKEISENEKEQKFNECVKEILKQYDDDYCNVIELKFNDNQKQIYTKSICVEQQYYKEYYNVLKVEYNHTIWYSLLIDNFDNINEFVKSNAKYIINSIRNIVKAFMKIYYFE